ncbi:MAG TPA: 3-deoxy-7-phosphoheptulonate synthase [Longimicrobiales bacterium]
MIVLMKPNTREGAIADVVAALTAAGARVHRLDAERVSLATTGGTLEPVALRSLAGVAAVLDASATPLVEASRPTPGRPAAERGFEIGAHRIGGLLPVVFAGPCSVEDEDTMHAIAQRVAAAGAIGLRAGVWKPRTSPYAFQGAGEDGLMLLRRAADAHGLLVVSEVLDATQIPLAARYCDVLQVGARNMHNASLLRELGRARRPVLLKRGMAATVDEWIAAAEYVVSAGERRVILCERGIRTFETSTRNTLDLNAVAVARERTQLPVLVDPSHGTGRRTLVPPLALAAIAAGADGLLIEAHVEPDRALSDGVQTIGTDRLAELLARARALAALLEGGSGISAACAQASMR